LIVEHGFWTNETLPSVSFVNNSGIALGYACSKRSAASPSACIIAVRFDLLEQRGIARSGDVLHVYRFNPQKLDVDMEPGKINPHPEIIRYCIVPASYEHL
jgi:hypothetical protein